MAATPTTKSQVQAYRFVLRRMEHALVRKDAVMLHDPMRTQVRATAVGLVLGLLGLAGFALYSVFSPAQDIGQGTIFVGKESANTYVVREEAGRRVLHPVLNLASARLVAGTAAAVSIVDDSALDQLARGPLLGIDGAPNVLPSEQDRPAAVWTVCDSTDVTSAGSSGDATTTATDGTSTSTSVLVGELSFGVTGAAQPLGPEQALLVRDPDGRDQLLYDGKRAVVDPTKPALARALKLSGVAPRPVSAGLLNAVPAVPELTVPTVDGAGGTPSYPIGGATIGDVVDVQGTAGKQYYVVLRNSVQPVNGLVADLLVSRTGGYVEVATNVLSNAPVATRETGEIDLTRFPDQAPTVLGATDDPVACLSWDGTSAGGSTDPASSFTPRLTVLVGTVLPLPASASAVTLASTGTGGIDSFYLPPGQGAVVQARDTGQPSGDGTRYLVSDTGTRFGIDSSDTAAVLGLGTTASPAPSALLALLPQGAALNAASALRAHDGVAADPGAVAPTVIPTTGAGGG